MTVPMQPKPLELKRLTGRHPGVDSGGRALPDPANVVALRSADRMPEYPTGIGDAGAALWRRAWAEAIVWLSPDSDMEAVERACRLADDLAAARRRYHATTDHRDGSLVVKLSKEFGSALSELGFTPLARTRMGVAEVKRMSKLDELRRRNSIPAEVVDDEQTG